MPLGGLVRLSPREGAQEELLQRVRDVAEDVRREEGNLLTLLLRDPSSPGDVLMLELFRDEAAVEYHRRAPHTLEKGPAIHALLAVPMESLVLETIDWRD